MGRRGRKKRGKRGGAGAVRPLSPPSIHPPGAGTACRTHARSYLCAIHLITSVCGSSHCLPDHMAIAPSNWHFAQWWRGIQSVWTHCGALWCFVVVQMGCRLIKTRSTALQNRDFPIFSPVLTRVSAGRWSKVGLFYRFGTHNFVALTRAVECFQRICWAFKRGNLVTR